MPLASKDSLRSSWRQHAKCDLGSSPAHRKALVNEINVLNFLAKQSGPVSAFEIANACHPPENNPDNYKKWASRVLMRLIQINAIKVIINKDPDRKSMSRQTKYLYEIEKDDLHVK